MDSVFTMTFKIDMSINEEDVPAKGASVSKKNPIGKAMKINGTVEEIKRRICHEIDKTSYKLEDLYYGEE